MDAGLGWQRIADIAGVSTGVVSRILYGDPDRPCNRVRKEAADALLAVQATPETLANAALVDATGTCRRTQALAALGWSLTEQARRLGRTVHNHKYVLTNNQVTRRTAQMVAHLYDELSTKTPPPSPIVTRTKKWAQSNGWAPPLAWDDIDDPNEQPNFGDPNSRDNDYDEITVALAVDGRLTYAQLNAHRPDLVEAVRRLARTLGDLEIAHLLRVPGAGEVMEGSKTRGQATVTGIRTRAGIPACPRPASIAPRIRRSTKAA
jgi:hypothetical protein